MAQNVMGQLTTERIMLVCVHFRIIFSRKAILYFDLFDPLILSLVFKTSLFAPSLQSYIALTARLL